MPYRIIPVIDAQKDNFNEDGETGLHSFSIVTTKNLQDMCAVEDDLFPYPAKSITNINKALEFSIQQMEREKVSPHMIFLMASITYMDPSNNSIHSYQGTALFIDIVITRNRNRNQRQ